MRLSSARGSISNPSMLPFESPSSNARALHDSFNARPLTESTHAFPTTSMTPRAHNAPVNQSYSSRSSSLRIPNAMKIVDAARNQTT